MTKVARRRRLTLGVVIVLVVAVAARFAMPVSAESGTGMKKIKLKSWSGTIDYREGAPSPFTLQGKATRLRTFTGGGEVALVPHADGSLVGDGSVVFATSDGSRLVGTTHWVIDARSKAQIDFHWPNTVTFSDGSTYASTGRFADARPPGLVVIAIIAILIGLLLPA